MKNQRYAWKSFEKWSLIKRINRDLKEITKSPIEGVGIVSLANHPMNYIVNIKLLEGLYKNYCV